MNLYDVYSLIDLTIVRGKGCHVWDSHGQEYLDLYGGHAVVSVGHSHPRYVEAIARQVEQIGFYSNSVVNPLQERFAHRLGQVCGYDDYSLFLVNSGAEAIENALKLASFHTGRTRVLAAERAFHGRTSLAVEATDNPTIAAPINKNNHVVHLPLNDTLAWVSEIERGDACAVIVEAIQGVGGIRLAEEEFLKSVRRACTATHTPLILDEVQCGYGRSGRFFAHQHLDVRADIITMGKGICNGLPMGGVVISPEFTPTKGQLGTTFGGNHLACAGALAVLDIIEEEHLIENARDVGEYLIARLREEHLPHVVEVRGRGLMIGIELDIPYATPRGCLISEQHCFTGCASANIIRLLPPLTLTRQEADDFMGRLVKVLHEV